MSAVTIRRAGPDDLDSLKTLLESAYRGDRARAGWTHEADLLDGERIGRAELAALLQDPDSAIVLAESDAGVVGCAQVHRTPQGAEFGKFAVAPALQNGGLGKRLLAAAEDAARALWAAPLMTMLVIRGRDELVAFYRRRGYAPTGDSVPLAAVHEADGWTRGRDLVLDVYARAL